MLKGEWTVSQHSEEDCNVMLDAVTDARKQRYKRFMSHWILGRYEATVLLMPWHFYAQLNILIIADEPFYALLAVTRCKP